VADHQWGEAIETLALGEKRKHIDKDMARRRRAVLLTAQADNLSDAGKTEEAAELAVSAAQDAPEFSPAVALAAKLLGQKGAAKKAKQLIDRYYSRPKSRSRRAMASRRGQRSRRLSLLKRRAQDYVPLRLRLRVARLCTLAAKAEDMLQNTQDARIWMERAATASAEPDWSDLDPEGDAFDYTNQDWRRLIYTYGAYPPTL